MVEHFTKKQKKAETVATKEDIKSNAEMTDNEVKYEVSVRYVREIPDRHRHKFTVSVRLISHSRRDEKSDKFV